MRSLPPQVVDMIDLESELAKHCIRKGVILYPTEWRSFNQEFIDEWEWTSVPFTEETVLTIPNNKGVYSFSIKPPIANHPHNSLLIYIGKAHQDTFRDRFKDYLRQMRRTKRPQIATVLNRWYGFLQFSYCPVIDTERIQQLENGLLKALIPPYNHNIPGEIGVAVRAGF